MKNGGHRRSIVRRALPVCFLLLVFTLFSSVVHAEEGSIGIDKDTLKQQLADMAVEKIFGELHKVPEDKLKDVTYFNELVKDMAPLGIKLDETNFSDTALSIYNKYKEAIEKGKTPEEAKQNVKDLLKGDVKSLIFQSLDEGSQEVLTDLQGLYDNAQSDLKAILDLNKELEEDPKADYAELMKKYGIKGEMLEKFEKLEGQIRGIADNDYVKAGQIIYGGMSGSSGDKIEALFELGSEFGGKIPVLGRFVELYFKVAKEMINATGRLGKLLDARQAGCLGVGTVGFIETVSSVQNERNVAFSKTFGGTVCPVERAAEFYGDIYVDINNPNLIYFWTGGGFEKGNAESGGVDSLKALRAFLRTVGEADKANDMQFMIRAFNFKPGFLVRQKEYKEIIEEIRSLIQKLDSSLYCVNTDEYNNFLKEKCGLQGVIDSSDGLVESNPTSRSIWLGTDQVVEKMLKDRYVEEKGVLVQNCRTALDKLRDVVPVRIKGEVFIDREGETDWASGAQITVDPADKIVEKCSSLSTDGNGLFELLVLKVGGESISLSLQAKLGEDESDKESVSISGSNDRYNVKLSIKGTCEEGTEMKNGKCVPICEEGEELNKAGTKCLPECEENEERDEKDNCVCVEGYETVNGECVEKCEPEEKRNDKGECEPICPEGQKMNDAGKCEDICKPNEKFVDGACEAVCEEGYKLEKDGKCTKLCEENREPNKEGECVCKKGLEEVDGKCQKGCGLNAKRNEAGECVCKDGFEDVKGVCAPVCKPNEKRNDDGKCVDVCGPNAWYDAVEDACECNEGFEDVKGKCLPVCNAGEKRDAKGECVPPCKPNEKLNDDGKCVDVCGPNARYIAAEDACECNKGYEDVNGKCVPECKEGEKRSADGKCEAACGENEIRGADGSCACKAGFVRDDDGVCILDKGDICTSDDDCSTGYKCDRKSGECVFIKLPGCEETGCPEGYECNRKSGECVYKKSSGCSSDDECPKGYVCGSNGECVYKKSGGCSGDDECPKGYVCGSNGECVFKKSSGCSSDDECPKGYVCGSNGQCVYKKSSGCSGDDECPKGYVCGSNGECVYQKESGCRSSKDCSVGYVCSGGECVSPFDPNYSDFTSQLGNKDNTRSQGNIDRSTTDQTGGGRGGGFTSAEVEGEIDQIDQTLGCRGDGDCRGGYRCVGGRCEKEEKEPTKPPETPPPTTPEEETPPQPPVEETPPQPPVEEETPPQPPAEEPPPPPVEPATSTGIGVEVVGTAPEGQTLIVDGQLVPVEGWPVKIAGMTLALTGPVNKSTSSSGSGTFNFTLIPAGEYTISVAEWNYGMTSQGFTAPSGKAIKITLKGSCPYLYVWTGDGYAKENDIYSVARIFPSELLADKDRVYADREGLFLQQVSVENMSPELMAKRSYRDYYRINGSLAVDTDGYYRAKVREQAYERSLSDQFELWAVDHPAGLRTGVTCNGRLFNYKEILPLAASVQTGGALLFNKEFIEVALPAAAFGNGALAVDWQGFQNGDGRGKSASSGRPKLSLQRLSPDGIWQTVDYVYPRDENQNSFFILDDLGAGWDKGNTVRLVSTSCVSEKYNRIDAVGWTGFLPETPTAVHLPLVSAVTSGGDDVRLKAMEADGDSIFLGPDEEVILKFNSYPMAEGMERSFVFVSQGVYVPMPMILLGEAQ